MDTQLVEVFELMVEKCNVRAYKSNQRTFERGGWRYCAERDKWSHFTLDYRIVCQYIGGMSRYTYTRGTLEDRAAQFIEDLRTVAHNLGFQRIEGHATASMIHWTPGATETFDYRKPDGGRAELFTVRAFGNGNLHLKLNKQFILALNVEHGRLKGWLKTPAEAAQETGDAAAAKVFRSNLTLTIPANPLLTLS